MKATDRGILAGIAIVGLLAAFWFLVLSPKRDEASKLSTQVSELRATVEQEEQEANAGLQAQQDFPENYRKLVNLGKAVPEDADTPSLLNQLEVLSQRSDVGFRSITLTHDAGVTATSSTTTSTESSTSTESESTESDSADSGTTADATAAAAPASEVSAATLPLGATVGPAGLAVMPYSLEFDGGFFQVADFFGRLDGMVDASNDRVGVDGRLLTIDGFQLVAAPDGFPSLTATVQATSYLTPADQGVTAGATPSGPAATTDAAAATTTDPSSSGVATATVTP